MSDIPEEAIQAAAEAVRMKEWRPDAPWSVHAVHSYSGECAVCSGDIKAIMTVGLEAALPHLESKIGRRPRMICPVCTRDVVRRDNGRPVVHYAKNNNPQFSCKGDMFSHCRGGCRCAKHR